MPPADEGEPLSAVQIGILRLDRSGAEMGRQAAATSDPASDHWAFQPIRPQALPRVARNDWPLTPADSFIAAAPGASHLGPSELAAPATRCVACRSTSPGLPPTVDELDEFLRAAAKGTRCLVAARRPLAGVAAYGERWGRHWLELARWAESEGYELNHPRPYAWKYRDFVIRSFNRDRPYDEFLRDRLPATNSRIFGRTIHRDGLPGGGRLSSNEDKYPTQCRSDRHRERGGRRSARPDRRLSQCHNHKFDPLTQRDYRLQASLSQANRRIYVAQPGRMANYEAAEPGDLDPAVSLARPSRAVEKLLTERREKFSPATRAAIAKPPADRPANKQNSDKPISTCNCSTARSKKRYRGTTEHSTMARKEDRRIEKSLPTGPQLGDTIRHGLHRCGVDILPMRGFYPLLFQFLALNRRGGFLPVRGDIIVVARTSIQVCRNSWTPCR